MDNETKDQPAQDEPAVQAPEELTDNPDALNSDYKEPNTDLDATKVKRSFAERVKGLTNNFNIYLMAFLVIVFIALVITYVALNSNNDDGPSISSQELTEEAFEELAQNESNVGETNQTLTVEANAIFNGKVLVKDNLDVAGSVNIGGPLTLPGITVAGNSAFEDVEVNNNLAILGDASVQGALTVGAGANINGNVAVAGEISATSVIADTISFDGDLRIQRHLDTGGPAPSVTRGGAVGSGGTVSISGTDASGTVTINTGGSPSSGTLAIVTFAQSYTGTPRVVITPTSAAGSNLDYYVSRTSSSFEIRATSAPSGSSTYLFDFWVAE